MQIEKIFVVKMGEMQLLAADGSTVTDTAFVREAGGFNFFGDACLDAITRSTYTVRFLLPLLICRNGRMACVHWN